MHHHFNEKKNRRRNVEKKRPFQPIFLVFNAELCCGDGREAPDALLIMIITKQVQNSTRPWRKDGQCDHEITGKAIETR